MQDRGGKFRLHVNVAGLRKCDVIKMQIIEECFQILSNNVQIHMNSYN